MDGGTAEQDRCGSAGKFQRLADSECAAGSGPRIRKVPSKDTYEYNAPPIVAGVSFPGEDAAPGPPHAATFLRSSSSKRKISASDVTGESSAPPAPAGSETSDPSAQPLTEDTEVQFGMDLSGKPEPHGVHFHEDTKSEDGFRQGLSLQRKGTPGVVLVSPASKSCDGSSQGPASTRVSFGPDSPDSGAGSCWPLTDCASSGSGGSAVKFSEDTKPGPSFGRVPSIQRKGTPGLALMSDLADAAAEFGGDGEEDGGMSVHFAKGPLSEKKTSEKRTMFRDEPPEAEPTRGPTGVHFMEEPQSGPRLQRSASAIQRKATPGLALMPDLAVPEEENSVHFKLGTKATLSPEKSSSCLLRKGTPGVALMSDLADMAAEMEDSSDSELQTPSSAVQFTPDTKPGPSFNRSASIQRKGTPGVALMSDMADIAAEIESEELAKGPRSPASVHFSRDTPSDASRCLQRSGSSIERKATPGLALMSDLADFASGGDHDMDSDEDPHGQAAGVKFSEDTNPGPALGRSASSIRRTATPGVALLSGAADIAAEIGGAAAPQGSSGVSFSEGTKLGPTTSGIQRKGTPGAGLMSDLADIAADVGAEAKEMADCDADGVRFAADVKPGPSLNRQSSSIQRKGTPGVALMSDLADAAAEWQQDGGTEDMPTVLAVRFSEDTKLEPAFGRAPSIQRKGTPGAGLLSDLTDMAADLQGGPGPAVHFSDGTDFEPSVQRSGSSIERKGTPGVALMSELADIAAEEEEDDNGDDEEMADRGCSGVRFCAGTKSEPAFGRTPSIQRRATPACGLGPDVDPMEEEEEQKGGHGGGVRFSEGTKLSPSLARGPSIQRKGTLGCGLMPARADMAAEEDPFAEPPSPPQQQNPPARRFMKMASASRVDYTPHDLRKPRFSLTSDPLVRPPDLGQVGAELSAIFSRPSAPAAASPSLVAPVARRFSTQAESEEPLEVLPRMLSDSSAIMRGTLGRSRSLGRSSLPAMVHTSNDSNMEGLTAAMAELGHPEMQRD
mmetsp:Transcript_36607/g.103362  ORF Transcript_36607/g.103362 Transcript_36607/m.103362 type:complete len:1011 (+) Transcript_36607:187-3219(+)|eukprot:CAMPEP_0117668670 /NCGR_PEP_ID=MMETSP0804-20121206/11684_1 /TAXON_ID=1074897 /ORGANISM="Tetraselmis astigmatica, Strain CCMP880" /LENGTH=1010 /DNA_ID=CAMNT_0005476599 /DNA_START=248 /DNA_END=3280 /DNA_ORIENTATION=+